MRTNQAWMLAALALTGAGGGSQEPAPAPERLVLRAVWEPLAGSHYGLYGSERLKTLLGAGPSEPERAHPHASFARLLPAPSTALGEPFALDPELFLPFLRQFHPGATARLHHGGTSEGAFGCVTARAGDGCLELLYRVHADLVLEPDAVFLTPAQFEGRMLWDGARAREFSLALPPRNSNADINARVDDDPAGFVADIGFIPRMELAGRSSEESGAGDAWDERLAADEARARLARAFYPFAAIAWSPLDAALQRARLERKPLHVVILFGTLDDESC